MAPNILTREKLKFVAVFILVGGLLGGCNKPSDNSAAYLNKARQHYEAGEFSSAIIELKNVSKVDQNNVAARKLLGDIYFQQGKFLDAEKELERAHRLDTLNAEIILSYANTLLRLDSFKQLKDVLKSKENWNETEKNLVLSIRLLSYIKQNKEEAAKKIVNTPQFMEGKEAEVIYARALFYRVDNQLQNSQKWVAVLLEEKPNHLEGLLLQGDLFYIANDYDNALSYYQKSVDIQQSNLRLKIKLVQALIGKQEFSQAEKILREVVSRAPLFHEANYYYAFVKLQSKDYESALIYAKKVLKLIPGHDESIYIAAQAAYFLKQFETSLRFTKKLANAYPRDNSILKLLAANQLKLKQHQDAAATLGRINNEKLDEKDASLFVAAANMLSDTKDLLARKQLYLRAADADPTDTTSRWGLAVTSYSLGNGEEGNQYLSDALENEPDSLVFKAALISSYIRNNQLEKAETAIKELIASDDTKPDGYALQGLLYLNQNNTKSAVASFERALRLNPNEENANHNLAIIDIVNNDFVSAKSRYEKILVAKPDNLRAMKQMWLLEKKLGNDLQSIYWLEKAAEVNPNDVAVNIGLAEHYILEKDYLSAVRLLKPVEKDLGNVLKIRLLLGQAYYLAGNAESALRQFTQAGELSPKDPTNHFWTALVLEKEGDTNKALVAANKALKILPEDKLIQIMVVRLSLKSDNLDVAKPIIDKLMANFPEDVVVEELKAKYALQNGEYAKAASLFSSLFERHETNFVLVQWANALVISGQDEKALEQLGGWLKKYPNDLLVLNVLANEYLNRNQLPEAKAYFTVISELSPENPLAQNNLAWLLYKEGDISQAQIHAELAYEAFPDSPMIVDTLGQILLDQGEYERSKLMLRLANKKMPDNLETKYYLAQATAQGGDKATARMLLKQILSQKNNNSEAEQKLQRESQILLTKLGN